MPRAKATIDDVLRKLESVDRWRVSMECEKEKHAKTLYGNGEAGLDERIRIHEAELAALKKLADSIQPMIVFYKVGVWFAAIVGTSIVALIWGLLTGQAQLILK